MGKIPVGQTIAQAYGFSFGKYLTLLGIVWLPMAAIAVVMYFFLLPFLQSSAELFQQLILHPRDPEVAAAFNQQFGRIWLFDIVIMLVFVMIKVGITKEVLGLRTGPRFVYLAFGKDELYVLLNYIFVFVILYAAIIAVAIVVALIGVVIAIVFASAMPHFDPKASSGLVVAMVVPLAGAIECAFIYGMVRLTFLMVPVTVAEKRFGIGRSWTLTKGNFWRIFAIALAIWLPLIILEFLFIGLALASHVAAFIAASQKGPAAVAAEFAALWKIYLDNLLYISLIGFALAPVLYGLIAAPAAFAYRALVPEKPAEPAV